MKLIIMLLTVLFSSYSYATCNNNSLQSAPPITVDLSDKLTAANPVWTGSYTTQYTGSFNCSTNNSEFGYTKILNTDEKYATVLSFQNGKYNVRAEITSDAPNKKLSRGNHNASELNIPMTVRFSLVSKSGTAVAGDTVVLDDIMFVTDLSGLSLGEIIAWPLKQLFKILTWLFNGFHWPYDERDMYSQPMTIKYAPKLTTCLFTNSGVSVVLPTISRTMLLMDNYSGFTKFNLNIQCDNLGANNTSGRAIDMFLSSNTLLNTDHSVLVDNSSGTAKGVGLRLVNLNSANTPLVLSTSNASKGNATSLFSVVSGGAIKNAFSIPLGVYYYPWSRETVSQGVINTTATLNIIYP